MQIKISDMTVYIMINMVYNTFTERGYLYV